MKVKNWIASSARVLSKKGGDLEHIAIEWISTEMHHGMSAEPNRPPLFFKEFFY